MERLVRSSRIGMERTKMAVEGLTILMFRLACASILIISFNTSF